MRVRELTFLLVVALSFGCGKDDPVKPIRNRSISAPSAPTGVSVAIQGETHSYNTLGAVSSVPDTLEYRFDFDAIGGHSYSSWSSDTTASTSWPTSGTFVVQAQARSAGHPDVISPWSTGLTVLVEATGARSITAPSTPTGPSAVVQDVILDGEYTLYSTSGAVSSIPDALEYRFDFDATGAHHYSGWNTSLVEGTVWSSPGTFEVEAQARSIDHPSVVSPWSAGLTVVVTPAEAVSNPTTPTGPTAASTGDVGTYSVGGSTSNLGHAVAYRLIITDHAGEVAYSYSPWSSAMSIDHPWAAAGTYAVRVQARCSVDTVVTSFVSPELTVTVSPTGGVVVSSATLYLVTAGTAQAPLVLREVQGAWNEANVTWGTMPSLSDSLAGSSYFTDCFDECYIAAGFTLPSGLLQGWVDHTATNYGFAVGPGSLTASGISFFDRSSASGPRVQLFWHYQGETAQRSRIIFMSQDAYTVEAQPGLNFGASGTLNAGIAGGDQIIFVQFPLSLP